MAQRRRDLRPKPLPTVHPQPDSVGGRLPWIGAAPGMLRNPTKWFARQRAAHGDTFVVDALDNRVKHLRRHPVGVPLVIHTVRGRGNSWNTVGPSTGSEPMELTPGNEDSRPTRR